MPAEKKSESAKYRSLNPLEDGHEFTLTILPPSEARYGRTHVAKSKTLTWDGTAEQFRAQFDKI